MAAVRTVKLELLRHGPQHNQLLSPLTPYLALCGPHSAQTVTLPFEHRQLLLRLARLRYEAGGHPVAAAQREGELRELGETVGRVLGQVAGLQTLLAPGAGGEAGGGLVHLRLVLSALELGMVPFEVAIAPDNLPGSGAPLLLRTPTVLTREVRRADPIPVDWAREPRILFAFATPPGLAPVPAQAHLNALRQALEPYVRIKGDAQARLPEVRKRLTVLPEASLKDIADACRDGSYTHVHLLAHGAPFEEAGHQRFGLALRAQAGEGMDVVDGERLAIALRGVGLDGGLKPAPTLVSLATCDSGHVGEVVAPGGSIAHALHESGIPWVVASQFPLWMRASTVMVACLYGGLLAGADPRHVLHELRQRLRTEVPQTHDWASIVAYAVSPWDFEAQIRRFHDRQRRARLEVFFARMDELVEQPERVAEHQGELDALAQRIRAEHRTWLAQTEAERASQPEAHAEALGMHGASEKRIGIVYALAQRPDQARLAYDSSCRAYRQAVGIEPHNHWVITQVLALTALPELTGTEEARQQAVAELADWWLAARQIARWQLASPTVRGRERAWALGTLLELELLGSFYRAGPGAPRRGRPARDPQDTRTQVLAHCRAIVEAVGLQDFAVHSTRRQMARYARIWAHTRWQALAEEAVQALSG